MRDSEGGKGSLVEMTGRFGYLIPILVEWSWKFSRSPCSTTRRYELQAFPELTEVRGASTCEFWDFNASYGWIMRCAIAGVCYEERCARWPVQGRPYGAAGREWCVISATFFLVSSRVHFILPCLAAAEEEEEEAEEEDEEGAGEAKPKKIKFSEFHRLVHVVHKIDSDTAVVPRGAFLLTPTRYIMENRSFTGENDRIQ